MKSSRIFHILWLLLTILMVPLLFHNSSEHDILHYSYAYFMFDPVQFAFLWVHLMVEICSREPDANCFSKIDIQSGYSPSLWCVKRVGRR